MTGEEQDVAPVAVEGEDTSSNESASGERVTLTRAAVRFRSVEMDGIARLCARYRAETGKRISRAAMLRLVVARGLSGIGPEHRLVELLPLDVLHQKRSPRPQPDAGTPTLRRRILDAVNAHPGEVLTPARVATVLGAKRGDETRNALLILAAQGHIEKVGVGQYRAWPQRPGETAVRAAQGDA